MGQNASNLSLPSQKRDGVILSQSRVNFMKAAGNILPDKLHKILLECYQKQGPLVVFSILHMMDINAPM